MQENGENSCTRTGRRIFYFFFCYSHFTCTHQQHWIESRCRRCRVSITMRHNAKGQQIIRGTYLDILYIFFFKRNERAHEIAMEIWRAMK